jgi:hypothetical protein
MYDLGAAGTIFACFALKVRSRAQLGEATLVTVAWVWEQASGMQRA